MAELRGMADQHRYTLDLHWQGDHTRTYESYTREHIIRYVRTLATSELGLPADAFAAKNLRRRLKVAR